MRSWIFYKRKRLDSDDETFNVDVFEGDIRTSSKEDYLVRRLNIKATFPEKNPASLAKKVLENSLEIKNYDILTSIEAAITMTPASYMDLPASGEQIAEFLKAYNSLR